MAAISNPTQFRANVCNQIIAPKFITQQGPDPAPMHVVNKTKDETLCTTTTTTTAISTIMVKNLERAIFNWAIQEARRRYVTAKWSNMYFVMIYKDHLRSTYNNLTPDWVNAIQNRKIGAREFPFLTHQEMAPDTWADLIRIKSIRDKTKFEDRMEASTDTFQCRKCQSRRCNFYAMQTRSADEPMTLFVSCLDCGYRFKKS